MKLDRNGESGGKYAVLNMRKVREQLELERYYSGGSPKVALAIKVLEDHNLINYGEPKSEGEFFVIMLKDENADIALLAYSLAVRSADPEYSDDVGELAERSGKRSPYCKAPD